jgi:glucose-6-phosphate 1-epimerase
MVEIFRGLPTHKLSLPCGDELIVALHGAHVLSWVSQGRERLYLSPHSVMDGHGAIRGGVPVCFPQFNQRGSLPKHGFARNLTWAAKPTEPTPEGVSLTLVLSDSPATRVHWPQAFEAQFSIDLAPRSVTMTLKVVNRDTNPLEMTGALHSYLAVDDIGQASLRGLQGQAEWDSLTDVHAQAAPELRFDAEFDRVYEATPRPLLLQDGGNRLQIEQSPTWFNSVVWNPGAALSARMADLPDEGYQHMLCVEAAQVDAPVKVSPQATWQGWQRLTVLQDPRPQALT